MDSQPPENESTQPTPNIVDLFPFYSNYLWNRLTSLLPTSNSIFLGKISNLYCQTVSRERHISFPLPLPSDFPTSSTITSNTSADTARIYGVLEEIMADVLSNLHDIQKSLDFWQSRVEGSNARKAYFMIFERGPVAFVNESTKFVSKSLSEDSAMQHLCQSSSSHMMERIRVLVELRSPLASFLAQLNKRGEDLVKNPETSLASLLAVINGLFSNLEESFSHLHAKRECDSSVNGGYPGPLVFDRLPEVNEEGSQWTDCELTVAINLVHKNLEKLNSYLSVMVGKHRKPRRMTLYWVRYTFGAVGLSVFSLWLLRHSSLMGSSDIENWVRDAKEATVSFFSDHVEQPLLSIRDELFDTFRKRHKGVMESEEVQLTHDSLHRMLKNFCEQATREKVPDNASDQEMLTVVMHRYKKELVHPIHNLLSGELARGLLIQVQKLKLDIETAMLELDQILRANEINFAILAALPAFFLSIVMLRVLRTWLKKDSRAQGRGRIARIHRRLLVGKDAIEAGDRSRALKFRDKARRLDPSLPIDGLVSHLMKQSDGSVVSSAARESSKPWLRQRGSSSSSSSSFTEEEQRAIVREIKSKKDCYEILGLKNNCSVEDIRKAYRKLSLKVHPDKNKAPGSEEAFISVSKAFQCLSNEDTRRIYDITGGSSDEPVYQPRRAPTRYNNYEFNGFYDYEFDAPRRYNYEFSHDDILAFIDFLLLLYRFWRGFVSFLRRIKR